MLRRAAIRSLRQSSPAAPPHARLALVSVLALGAMRAPATARAAGATAEADSARAAPSAPAFSDPQCVEWATELLGALGGQAAWDALRCVRFAFTVARNDTVLAQRTHYWDKAAGRERVEGTAKTGKRFVCLVDLGTKSAESWVDAQKQTGADSVLWAGRAYALWVNDSYWLFMPYKMLDPGVTLADASDTTEVGVRYHRLHLTFAHVGLTPGDTYWAYVNATSHMMEKWAYVLQGEPSPPAVWWWEDWRKVGPLLLAPRRRSPTEAVTIEFRDLAYLPAAPAGLFTSPAPVAEGTP